MIHSRGSTEALNKETILSKVSEYQIFKYYCTHFQEPDKKFKSDLPRLVFVCANNHLYPIDDNEKRETIFKQCSVISGKINKYMATQKLEHKLNNNTKRHDYVLLPDMSFYGLLNKVCNDKTNNPNDDYRIIITTPGVCNDVFYSEIRQGNIHNGKVRLSKGNQIVGFEMYGTVSYTHLTLPTILLV